MYLSQYMYLTWRDINSNVPAKTVYNFKGGFHSNHKTIFDKLEGQGIHVQGRVYPWFVVYDFEAMLDPIKESNSAKLTWTQRHEPISVSVCSIVERFTDPHCIVEPEVETLVRKIVEYMTRIALRSYKLVQQKFVDAFAQLEEDINNPYRALLEDDDDDDYKLNAFHDDDEEEENEKEKNVYKKLQEELEPRQGTSRQTTRYALSWRNIYRQTLQQLRLFGQRYL